MRLLRVLIACEESQRVCLAFRARGHEAYSNDLQECSGGHPEFHLQMDAREAIKLQKWDLMIAHPPCTYLSRVAIQHNKKPGRLELRDAAIVFFMQIKNAPILRIAIENPVPQLYVTHRIGRYSQKIQPYYFGDNEMKGTCLWLKNLSRLNGSMIHQKPKPLGYNGRGNPYYSNEMKKGSVQRSKTFPGVARAMASQWSPDLGYFNTTTFITQYAEL